MTNDGNNRRHWFVAIGASGVGFDDIIQLLHKLPCLSNATLMVVLHQNSSLPSILADILSYRASMPVVTAVHNQVFRPGVCYVGEPAKHLTLGSLNSARLVSDRFEHQHRNQTIDLLFTSIAGHAQSRGIGVLLSGGLDDGSRGLAEIHHSGGLTMVLRPANGHSGDMPRNAIRYDGPIDCIGSVTEIAAAISDAVGEIS